MTIVNHECYVSLEVAKLLKEAGFDWEIFSHWVESDINNPDFKFSGLSDKPILYDGYTLIDEDVYAGRKKDWNNYNDECPLIYNYSAPTLAVAQKWLREVKKAHVICDLSSIGEPPGYSFNVFHFVFDNRGCYKIDENYQCTAYEWYPTYEESLEAGIKKALEIILEKGE